LPNAAAGSSKNITPKLLSTTSKLPAPNGCTWASATSNLALAAPAAAASRRASATWIREKSFRQVVRGALAVHRDVFTEGTVPAGQRDKWVGTIHRMQGREADVVILILGGQPDRPGARQWAAERPNLLNVAVTRARRRLYVIGSRRNWSRLPYFDVLAGSLPVWSPPAG
jgi:hypothetical protein